MNFESQIANWSQKKINSEYEASYGCLHIFLAERNLTILDKIREHIYQIYQKKGLKSLPWKEILQKAEAVVNISVDNSFAKKLEELFPENEFLLTLNLNSKIQPDDVIVLPEATEGWYEVSSRTFEWTLPGLNPLALELSKYYPILSTTHIEKTYDELTLYLNGAVNSMYLSGLDSENHLSKTSTESFDWNYFQDKGAVVDAGELRSTAALDFKEMLKLAGPDGSGYRNTRIDNPLSDFEPEFLLLFRTNDI